MFGKLHLVVSLICLVSLVNATLYVDSPASGSTCYGGQPCIVAWVDNGEEPLLDQIGACYVGLYNGNGVLVQEIEPVNVNTVHYVQFTPDLSAGPDSSNYYVNFTSVSYMVNVTIHYTQYSPDFALASMSGSFSSPVSRDTSTLAVPSTALSPAPNSVTSVITISNSFSTTSSWSVVSSVAVTGSASGVSSSSPTSSGASSTTASSTSAVTSPSSSIVSTSAAVHSTHIGSICGSALFVMACLVACGASLL
ncbi:hypothetical protein WOLCODRAFT_109958 [Wolfiporia cocos MD-104 SS10]|uniref:Uncharacterized protein n=1 Tax=Wolfiporia cocos (strain MD-104) TaxID=742152 RepID=A0A2H3JCF4_WOLCO|nr:hypothetical protein WOLCODRAFT_109958 [Wolfiporia cocos MD-104 SS10]